MPSIYESYAGGLDEQGFFSDVAFQTFTVGTTGDNEAFEIYSVKFEFHKFDAGAGTITCNLKAVEGGGEPTGSALSSGTFDGSTQTNGTTEWKEIIMTPRYELQASTKYALTLSITADGINAMREFTGAYAGGNNGFGDGSETWTSQTMDLGFEVWGDPPAPPVTPTTAAAVDTTGGGGSRRRTAPVRWGRVYAKTAKTAKRAKTAR